MIDPFLVTGAPRVAGFNDAKPTIGSRVRQAKAFQYRRSAWDTLIIGNSRVEMGLNPEHGCFERLGYYAYNAGIPGAGVAEQLLFALNIIYEQDIQRVILSVDYTDFIVRKGLGRSTPAIGEYAISRFPFRFDGSNNPRFGKERALDYARSLFSLDALGSSVQTLVSQSDYAATRTVSGFNPAADFARATRIEGAHAIFEQKLTTLRSRLRAQWALTHEGGVPTIEQDALAEFARIAASRDIQIYLHTNPFHDSYWQLLRELGADSLHERWLAGIKGFAQANDNVVGFWDFSSDSQYTSEVVPPPGERKSPLNWFWESSHYRQELGDLMLNTMLTDQCGSTDLIDVEQAKAIRPDAHADADGSGS